MVKPPVTIPIALYLLWLAMKQWRSSNIFISIFIPVAVIATSFVVFGNWLPRWVNVLSNYSSHQAWRTTLWRAADQLRISYIFPVIIVIAVLFMFVFAWQKTNEWVDNEADMARLMLVITASFVVTPYLLSYYFVTLLVIVLPYVAKWRLHVAAGLYILTYLPILRVWVGVENAWIDIIFVIAIFGAVFEIIFHISPHQEAV
jgi:hypothetical protein